MFLAAYMFEDSTESANLGKIMLSRAAGESQQHFPDEAPLSFRDVFTGQAAFFLFFLMIVAGFIDLASSLLQVGLWRRAYGSTTLA